MDFRRDPRRILEQTRREVQAVLDDPRFPDDVTRREEAMRIAREGQARHNEVSRLAEAAYQEEKSRLGRAADPGPLRVRRSTEEMLEREAPLRRLERRWERNPDAIPEMYKRAIAKGDGMEAELMEEVAGEFVTDRARRAEFRDLTHERRMARLPASARTAAEQLRTLEAEETSILGGLAHQRGIMSGDMDNIRQGRKMVAEQQTDMRRHELREQRGGRDG